MKHLGLASDRSPIVASVAQALGIDCWRAACTPAAKTAHLEKLAAAGRHVLMVGDGLNDAPALAAAHVSLSPASAVDISQNAADAVFQGDRLEPVIEVLEVARRADRLIRQNLGAELVLLHVMSDRPLTDGERYLAETEYVDELLSSLQVPVLEGGDARLRTERVLRYYGDVARRFRQAIGERLMSRAHERAREKGVQTIQTVLEGGDPANTILRVANGLRVDTIVLGSRGLGNAKGLLMGSVSHKVAHLAECTCVSVK